MSDIFKELEEEEVRSLYKNQSVFAEDYNPQSTKEVLHRQAQFEEIVKCIHITAKGVRSELYIFGVSGVGKTYAVKAILNELAERLNEKFQYAWINCKTISPLSEYQIMKEISIQIKTSKKWGPGHSTKDIEDSVIAKHKEKPLLIVFDEADALAKKLLRLLYTFFDKGVSQILISNVFRWVEDAGMRIKSRSQNNNIIFGAYSKDEMRDILRFLAEKGLKEGVISEKILEKIAEYTTEKFLGDVRKGKYLMSIAVDLAIKEGVNAVTVEHVTEAIPKVEPTSLKDVLKNFSRTELVALAGFVTQTINVSDPKYANGKLATTGNVHHFYVKCAELNGLEPVGEERMKDYLERLEKSGILTSETKSHKTRGRTNVYYSNYKIENLGIALKELKIKVYGTGLIKYNEFFSEEK